MSIMFISTPLGILLNIMASCFFDEVTEHDSSLFFRKYFLLRSNFDKFIFLNEMSQELKIEKPHTRRGMRNGFTQENQLSDLEGVAVCGGSALVYCGHGHPFSAIDC